VYWRILSPKPARSSAQESVRLMNFANVVRILTMGLHHASAHLLDHVNRCRNRNKLFTMGAPEFIEASTGNILHCEVTAGAPWRLDNVRIKDAHDNRMRQVINLDPAASLLWVLQLSALTCCHPGSAFAQPKRL